MLKLCGFRVSNYHNKVRIALLEKGIPHEEDEGCFPSQKDEWLARSPLGKVPIIEVGGAVVAESQVILEYLEDAYPEKPLLPKDPLARAKVRELAVFIELHLELVARRLYREAFFGGKASDETKEEVRRDITKGVRGFAALAKFDPFVAGKEFTIADCAAAVHLPLVSMATKIVLGADALEGMAQVKPYLKMLGERPAVAKVNEGRKLAQAEMAARAKK